MTDPADSPWSMTTIEARLALGYSVQRAYPDGTGDLL